MWVEPEGDSLHVVRQTTDHDVTYARFLTDDGSGSEDTWVDVDTGDKDIEIDGTGATQTADACTIAVRSDGDIVVAYQGDSEMIMGTEFERIDWNVSTDSGKTWAGPVSIDNGGSVDWTGCVIVPGSSDRMHVFFGAPGTLPEAFQRTIRSDDSLETFPSPYDLNVEAVTYRHGAGVSYDDAGTQRVRCLYKDASNKMAVVKLDSADTPSVTRDAPVSDNDAKVVNNSIVAALAVDTKNLQLLYSGGGSQGIDQDLYRDTNDDDAGWGTDTEELDAITCNSVSPRVYDRSGTKLAFVYDDGGTVKYNEISLANVFDPNADAFRFYSDGTESGSSPKAAQDIDITLDPTGDAQFHLRYRVQNDGSLAGATTDDYALQVSKNSGSFVAVTGSSSNVQSDTASGLTADGATTNRGTNGITDGTGSFVAGEQEETNGVIEDRQLTASNFTEHVWACKLIDADLGAGDTLDFRVTLNAGSPGMTNDVMPRITTPGGDDLATKRVNLDGDGMLLISGG